MREALRRLRESGAVVTVRGRGSHLARTALRQPVGALYSLFATVQAAGAPQRSEVVDLAETTDPDAVSRLGLPVHAALVVLRRRDGHVRPAPPGHGGRPVEWRTTLVRGDRYRLTSTWTPHRPHRLDLAPLPDRTTSPTDTP